jgi:ABC-type uncharacterized transport system YnjBCD ATPase subunit
MIFVYIVRNLIIQKINIKKSSLILRKNTKEIIANINTIITAGKIITIKGSSRNLKYQLLYLI